MKELTALELGMLAKSWLSVNQTHKRMPMDYITRLNTTFMRFIFMRGIRLVSSEVTAAEKKIYETDLSLNYIGALRRVIDPHGAETEPGLVLLMISATDEQRQAAILLMRKDGVSF